ncbi:hypothetical protein [Sphingobacterium multivorum]|uniref:hypothetical protein n=1 Tax=Sphingobacterium multivorum TaxID=28454 RepID=UPI0028A66090|nr:hypothetical protein [Sphingobacterium multivorum]
MSSKKQFIDEVFTTFEINSLIERRKCRATGKVRFNSKGEAGFFIHWLKWRYKKWLRGKNRRKRSGEGKPKQRYVYHCIHCGGYHITKENPHDYKRKKEKYEQKYDE